MAEKDQLRPWLGDVLKIAGKRAFAKAESEDVFGEARRLTKMFRAGLYAHVSTNDQQTLSLQTRAMREYAAVRLDDKPASSRGEPVKNRYPVAASEVVT
jgi:hypothetical protein